jgi:hypothetical protein
MPHRNLSRWERILYLAIFALALFSRFYSLGDRAISHDESLHAKFAWNLYAGRGFRHDPVMHGPLLFEGTALSFFLFGVSDFSARIFAALAGVALVMAPLLFRKWLRPEGSLAASVMLLISPSILYYSRYIRHDVLLMLTAVLLLWAIFQYLHEGRSRQLYRLAAFFSLMYATKEASYLYTAIFLALLAAPFAWQIAHMRWMRPRVAPFFVGLLVLVIVLGAAFVLSLRGATVEEQTSDAAANARMVTAAIPWWGRVSVALALLAPVGGLVLLCYGVGEEAIRQARLFDVLMVMGTLTLPLGSAFLMAFVAGLDMDAVYQAAQTGIYNALSPIPRRDVCHLGGYAPGIGRSGPVVGQETVAYRRFDPLRHLPDLVHHVFHLELRGRLRPGEQPGLLDDAAGRAARGTALVLLPADRSALRVLRHRVRRRHRDRSRRPPVQASGQERGGGSRFGAAVD